MLLMNGHQNCDHPSYSRTRLYLFAGICKQCIDVDSIILCFAQGIVVGAICYTSKAYLSWVVYSPFQKKIIIVGRNHPGVRVSQTESCSKAALEAAFLCLHKWATVCMNGKGNTDGGAQMHTCHSTQWYREYLGEYLGGDLFLALQRETQLPSRVSSATVMAMVVACAKAKDKFTPLQPPTSSSSPPKQMRKASTSHKPPSPFKKRLWDAVDQGVLSKRSRNGEGPTGSSTIARSKRSRGSRGGGSSGTTTAGDDRDHGGRSNNVERRISKRLLAPVQPTQSSGNNVDVAGGVDDGGNKKKKSKKDRQTKEVGVVSSKQVVPPSEGSEVREDPSSARLPSETDDDHRVVPALVRRRERDVIKAHAELDILKVKSAAELALQRRISEHDAKMYLLKAECESAVTKGHMEHATALRIAEEESAAKLHAAAVELHEQSEKHTAEILRLERLWRGENERVTVAQSERFATEIEACRRGSTSAVASKDDELIARDKLFAVAVEKQQLEHRTSIAELKSAYEKTIEVMASAATAAAQQHSAVIETIRSSHEAELKALMASRTREIEAIQKHCEMLCVAEVEARAMLKDSLQNSNANHRLLLQGSLGGGSTSMTQYAHLQGQIAHLENDLRVATSDRHRATIASNHYQTPPGGNNQYQTSPGASFPHHPPPVQMQ